MSLSHFLSKIEIEGSIILNFIEIHELKDSLKEKFYSYRFYSLKNIKEKFNEENDDLIRLMFYVAILVDDKLKNSNNKPKKFHDKVLDKLFLSYKDRFGS